MEVRLTQPLRVAHFKQKIISQGSAATSLNCSGMFKRFVTNLLLNLPAKELLIFIYYNIHQ